MHLFAEFLQFLTNQSRLLLLGLRLLDFANGVLYLAVRLGQQLLSLRLRTVQNGFALAFYLFQIGFVALDMSLQRLFMLMDGLTLTLPIALVAHNVL